jgi:hypothetical protein
MTSFVGGPADNKKLMLKRTPVYLRVTQDRSLGKIDALDQTEDEPNKDESLFAYKLTKKEGGAFLDARDPKTGKRTGGYYPSASYTLIDPQPDEAVMRDSQRWEDWVMADHARRKSGETS